MLFCYELTRKILTGYDQVCATFCREQGIARTSFDILLFLANNPAYNTARDIVQVRHLKANLVSIHRDRLKALQQSFFSKLGENIDADSMAIFLRTLEIMNQNMDRLLEEKN